MLLQNGGLAEVYVIAGAWHPEKARAWREPLRGMFHRLLEFPEWFTVEAGGVYRLLLGKQGARQVTGAELSAAGDDEITVYLNGFEVAHSTDWKKPVTIEVTGALREGANVLAVRGRNGRAPGAAAVLVKLEARSPNNFGVFVVTDKSWVSSSVEAKGWEAVDSPAGDWRPAASLGLLGVAPWGNVLGAPRATPAESLTVLAGFKAELLKSSGAGEGSWICMTVDEKGRFIISPEKDQAPLLRVTLGAGGQVAKTERMTAPVRAAMGLLYAHGSLYLNGHGPNGAGLYRLVDANHDDQFEADEVRLLKNFEGDNEHGYHAVALGPDNMIYVLNGNHTRVPPGIASDSPYQNYAEDLLLGRQWDAHGHAKGILAPGGYVLRTDPEGARWELFCGGFRNAYDFDFNPDGEEVSGCITEETGDKVVLVVNPMTQQRQEVLKKDIQSRAVSKISTMPEGLLNTLTKDEMLDLLAYLESGGQPGHAVFAGANR